MTVAQQILHSDRITECFVASVTYKRQISRLNGCCNLVKLWRPKMAKIDTLEHVKTCKLKIDDMKCNRLSVN